MAADHDTPGDPAVFEAATGAHVPAASSAQAREAAVRAAFDGLLQIRRLMNSEAADPLAVPAAWECRRPVRAIALSLEAAGIPPSAVGPDGQRTATGYHVTTGTPPAVTRVEWLGPPGSGAQYQQHTELRRCADVLRGLGWEPLEYQGPRRHRHLDVEPGPGTPPSR
ncbi:hypothetical protein AB0H17_08880 [Streptomyces olivoreticuli]